MVVVPSPLSVILASAGVAPIARVRAVPAMSPIAPILTESDRPSLNFRMEKISFDCLNIFDALSFLCMI